MIFRNYRFIAVIVFIFCLEAALKATPDSTNTFEFDLSIRPDTVTIGDEIYVEFEIRYPSKIELSEPTIEESGQQFALKSEPKVETRIKGDLKISTYSFVLAAFEQGELEIPAYVFYWYDDENIQNSIVSPVRTVQVLSVLPADTTQHQLRDIIGPKELPVQWLYYILVAIGAIIVAYIAYYLYKRESGDIELPETPPEPPYDIAIGKLVSLKTRDLPGKGRYKQYYIELSEIIKHYIQGRFEIIAVEATTYEIKRDLKHPELPRDKAEMIISLLTRSDLIKFAKQMPKPEAPVEDYNIARLFVTSTKPVVIIADNQTSPAEVSR